MRTLILNRHGRPLLSRNSFTRALRKTRPCNASHHLSKNAQKMANDWFIIHKTLCENKRQKNTREERGMDWIQRPFLRAVQGIRGLSYTGGSGANGLKLIVTESFTYGLSSLSWIRLQISNCQFSQDSILNECESSSMLSFASFASGQHEFGATENNCAVSSVLLLPEIFGVRIKHYITLRIV